MLVVEGRISYWGGGERDYVSCVGAFHDYATTGPDGRTIIISENVVLEHTFANYTVNIYS